MEDSEEPDIEIPTFEPSMPEASTRDAEETAVAMDPLDLAPPMLLPRGDSINESFSAEHVDDSEPDALALVASAEEATGEFEMTAAELQKVKEVDDVPKPGVEVPDEKISVEVDDVAKPGVEVSDEKIGVEVPDERPPGEEAAPNKVEEQSKIVESVDDEPSPAAPPAEEVPGKVEKVAVLAAAPAEPSHQDGAEPPPRDGAGEELLERQTLSGHVGLKEGGPALAVLNKYASILTRCPCCMITLYLVSVLVFTGALWKQFELEQDFSSFINADGDASRQRDAYLLALDEQEDSRRLRRLQEAPEGEAMSPPSRARRGPWNPLEDLVTIQEEDSREQDHGSGTNTTVGSTHGRRLGTLYIHKELTLAYAARSGNALEEPVLREMHDLESRLRSLPEVQEFSYTGSNVIRQWLGDPGQSFDALAWPSQQTGSIKRKHFDVEFDARGTSLLPLPAVLDYMRQFQGNTNHPYNYRRYFQSSYQLPDFGADIASSPPKAIRSHFSFYIPVGLTSMPSASISAAVERVSGEYDDLVKEVFYPMFQNAHEDYRHIDVYYEGDVITSYEVEHTLWMDCWYAVGSMLFVTVYMFFHIGKGSPSCSLCSILCNCSFSLVCIFIIFASIPVAYVLTPTAKITVASFLSIFLMAGIGSDVIFVFVDFWEQSKALNKAEDRVVFTMVHSGRACFATSLTTSVSFFANLASVLKPLREFGLFMGLCVLNAFLLVLLFLPPMLVIRERRMRRFSSLKVAQEPEGGGAGEPGSSAAWGSEGALAVMPETPASPSANRTCCGKQGKKKRKSQHVGGGGFLFNLVGWISRCPATLVLCCFILMVIFAVGVVTSAKLDDGSPDIFPPDHNQVIGKETLEKFESLPEATLGPPSSASVCKAQVMDAIGLADGGSGTCDFHWCEAHAEAASTTPTGGVCFRTPTLLREASNARSSLGSSFAGCNALTVKTRLAAEAAPTNAEWQAAWAPLKSDLSTSGIQRQWVSSVQELSTLVQENWERGAVNVSRFFSAGETLLLNAPDQEYFAFTFNLGVQFTSDQAAAACQLVQSRAASAAGHGLAAADVICSTWSDFDAAVFAAGNATISANAVLPSGVAGSSVRAAVDLAALADGIVEDIEASVLGGAAGLQALDARYVDVKNSASQVICEIDTMCFFGGTWPCDLPGWESMGQVSLPDRRRLGEVAQDFAAPTAGASARALASASLVRSPFDVTLVWGIRAPKSTPLVGELDEPWSFDPTFEPSNPWAQRAMLAACENVPSTLYVISASQDSSLRPRCWISDFKNWLETLGRRFPSRDFDEDLNDWIRSGTTPKLTAQKHLWMVNGKMRACKIQFHVNMNSDAPAASVLDFQEKWDEYVDGLNNVASVTANQMYHTASPWVRAEAEKAIVRSTLDTIIVACVCAWAGMLLFTGDPILSLQVTGLVVIIILGLAFFMVSVMGWKIGAIEVISLVVFVGYSVTYSLHIAHNYSEAQQLGPDFWLSLRAVQRRQAKTRNAADEAPLQGVPSDPSAAARELPPRLMREAQTSMAMQHVGGATLSSAVSTIGSSIFLLFCTLNIFIKLGAVVIAVTGLSVLFALVALPAVLLRFGPPAVPLHRRLLDRLLKGSRGGRGRPRRAAAGQESPLAPLVEEEVDLA